MSLAVVSLDILRLSSSNTSLNISCTFSECSETKPHYCDNGVMIGWTGILRYKAEGGHSIEDTMIKPKERMDQITIPWRSEN